MLYTNILVKFIEALERMIKRPHTNIFVNGAMMDLTAKAICTTIKRTGVNNDLNFLENIMQISP
jgi:hypothetical protein